MRSRRPAHRDEVEHEVAAPAAGAAPPPGLLGLQHAAGNAATARLVQAEGGGVVQRDLAAYTRTHVTTRMVPRHDAPDVIIDSTSADAPRLEAALRALVTAGKVGVRTVGDLMQFSPTGVTHAEAQQALLAAGYPRAIEMATKLLDGHTVAIQSGEHSQVIPGLIWDTVISKERDNVETQTTRGLTPGEMSQAALIYGGSIDLGAIVLDEDPIMTLGGYARTTPWNVNFPPGTLSGGLTTHWLIHELAHSWQYARGEHLGIVGDAIRGVYAYGGTAELARRTAAGQGLSSFNHEQQADIAADAHAELSGSATADRATYAPYVQELRAGAYK